MIEAAITGGRDYYPNAEEIRQLVVMLRILGIDTVRHGDCRGCDRFVANALRDHGIIPVPYPADWSRGHIGGPERNARMVEGVAYLFAFRGGRGTANAIKCARAIGVPVVQIKNSP